MTSFRADVYVVRPGEAPRCITPGDGIYYQACIHPYGTHVVYAGAASGPPRVWLHDLASGEVRPLTPADSGARHPVFSADGARVAFTSDREQDRAPQPVEAMHPHGMPERGNLFATEWDGGATRRLTRGPHNDQRPCFHPDGRSLVFVSDRAEGLTLFSVPADGAGDALAAERVAQPRPLPYRGFAYRPWYAADGHWIYFFRDVDGRHRICRVRPDEPDFEPLANDDAGMSHGPFADPRGDAILVHTTRDGTWGLWELPLDGSAPRRLELPGIEHPTHGTRACDGTLAFDVVQELGP